MSEDDDLIRSPALNTLPEDLQMEFHLLYSRNKEEIEAVEGLTSIHDMLVERFTFLYVALRSMEREWQELDTQRYNQLLGLWLKVGSDLLARYKEIYAAGALNQVFSEKVLSIVVSEVNDPETISRIRARLVAAAKEAQTI